LLKKFVDEFLDIFFKRKMRLKIKIKKGKRRKLSLKIVKNIINVMKKGNLNIKRISSPILFSFLVSK